MGLLQNQFGEGEAGSLTGEAAGYPGKAFGSFVTCHCETSMKSLPHNISIQSVKQKIAVKIPWRQLSGNIR
jgi:hypothetical protein